MSCIEVLKTYFTIIQQMNIFCIIIFIHRREQFVILPNIILFTFLLREEKINPLMSLL